MADSPYLVFYPNGANAFVSETITAFKTPALIDPFPASGTALTNSSFFPVSAWSDDIRQTLNIGAQATGAGAGKITFNPFSITRKVDAVSPTLFYQACAGTPFKFIDLLFLKSSGGNASPSSYLAFRFGLIAIETITWKPDDEDSPSEVVTFEYGSLTIGYRQQNPDGSFKAWTFKGWDRVKNVSI